MTIYMEQTLNLMHHKEAERLVKSGIVVQLETIAYLKIEQ